MNYRKRLMRSVFTKLDELSYASKISKTISILDAVYWIAAAVKDIKQSTVQKCFSFCGIIQQSNVIAQEQNQVQQPSVTIQLEQNEEVGENDLPLSHFVQQAREKLNITTTMDCEAYENIDEDCPVTEPLDDGWEKRLADELNSETVTRIDDDAGDDAMDNDKDDTKLPTLVTTYSQAMQWAYDLKLFALEKGNERMVQCIIHLEEAIQIGQIQHSRQAKIIDFIEQ